MEKHQKDIVVSLKLLPLDREWDKEWSHSVVPNSAIPWTVVYQASLSRQEYWSGLPFPSPGDLPDPGIEPRSPTLQADALPSEPPPLDKSGEIWTSKWTFMDSKNLWIHAKNK